MKKIKIYLVPNLDIHCSNLDIKNNKINNFVHESHRIGIILKIFVVIHA